MKSHFVFFLALCAIMNWLLNVLIKSELINLYKNGEYM
jgi:hypothetical protein